MKDKLELVRYIESSLELHDITLDNEQRQRVIDMFVMTANVASPLLNVELPVETEPAPTYEA